MAEWDQPVGNRAVTIDLDPTDLDAAGCFWLGLWIDPSRSSTSTQTQWKINELSVEFTGHVKGAKEASP